MYSRKPDNKVGSRFGSGPIYDDEECDVEIPLKAKACVYECGCVEGSDRDVPVWCFYGACMQHGAMVKYFQREDGSRFVRKSSD